MAYTDSVSITPSPRGRDLRASAVLTDQILPQSQDPAFVLTVISADHSRIRIGQVNSIFFSCWQSKELRVV